MQVWSGESATANLVMLMPYLSSWAIFGLRLYSGGVCDRHRGRHVHGWYLRFL